MLYSELDFERAPWDAISAEARALVQALLQRDAGSRPTAQEALSFRRATRGLGFTVQGLVVPLKPEGTCTGGAQLQARGVGLGH